MAQHENVPEHNANRLIGETSPYLLQHAYNPVDWYPWGPEALDRASRENKPILLSIGYAACHWCHVMERESFEDPSIAALMNDKFVCIKVDREERPDLDSIYMDAVQAMTGRGGWPMTMFLTPEGKPFYGGTYFPPDNRHGLPSFRMILEAVHDAWVNRQGEIASQTAALVEQISTQIPPASTEPLTSSLLTSAAQLIADSFDFELGGTAGAPKFPQVPILEFLLRGAGSDIGRSAEMVEVTLRKMALGGIYDQVGGGFARYSVDAEWLVPHFEKMLYDNAQLARVYTRAWQLTKSPLYERIAIETLEYLLRDMRDPAGGFYASEDADSEGEEGKFYVWSYDEFMQIAPEAADYYGVTPQGNFEGMNILTASDDGPPPEARGRLLAARSSRVRPARDDKILTSWNALAVSAFAEAGAAFGRDDFVEAASTAASFAITRIAAPDGRLLHSFKDDQARVLGMLEDYSYLAEALLSLWEVTLQPEWFEECNRICAATIDLFWDNERGGFYSTGNDHEQLIARPKEIIDGATPSPNAVASLVLQKLAVGLDEPQLAGRGVEILRLGHAYMTRAPQAAGTLLSSLDFYLSAPKEIVILGEREAALPLTRQIWTRFLPNKVLAGPGIDSPMLEAKTPIQEKPTAFVCENYACQSPTTDPAELAAQLS